MQPARHDWYTKSFASRASRFVVPNEQELLRSPNNRASDHWVTLTPEIEVDILLFESKGRETRKQLEKRFYRLANEWREDTLNVSSITELAMHPKYQSIIGMGPAVLPIIFRELQRRPDHWFWALTAITEANPVKQEDAGNLRKMTEAWLNWARGNSYL